LFAEPLEERCTPGAFQDKTRRKDRSLRVHCPSQSLHIHVHISQQPCLLPSPSVSGE
ncbi:hypothetical protein JOQ06_030189, partial [Pogonophryne albipinna]